ncbi:toxin-antitoxin system YwqK family antitoxin [Ohtaekwangia koreensis]|uniref:MORN repeat variant n=1 Tax=Ohtaekwangia koreensis TaxID=688867 RepID=A0A1T5MF51_9BACT|nr:hypothetical protein [Ohtaekwangia koreensis]SKC86871.1 MORN repeat variant [Ohtaekwangia koreensis]
MIFSNSSGTNKISIRLSEIGSYFRFTKPLTVVWYDCHGSVGKYLCALPYDSNERNALKKNIVDNINKDYTHSPDELKEILLPLLALLPNGNLSINFYSSENNTLLYYKSSADNYQSTHRNNWYIMISNPVNVLSAESKREEYENWISIRKQNNESTFDIIDYSTDNFYDGQSVAFIATQLKSEMNQERVAYFEERIKAGERPFAIIFNCSLEKLITNTDGSISDHSWGSANYILDGHHKLQAYHNLKIDPALAEIQHIAETQEEVEFNIEELIDALHPWQVEHILKNWYDKELYIDKYLKNPSSKLHHFIKNGFVQEFYKNGQVKHEAHYSNDHIEGEAKWWHENGQLKEVKFYENKKRTGIWQSWYDTGALQFVQPFNGLGNYHGHMVSYFENGAVRWEQFLNNGQNIDGYSYFAYYRGGEKEAELKYLNGRMIERKNYNAQGKLINFEELDSSTGKYINRV